MAGSIAINTGSNSILLNVTREVSIRTQATYNQTIAHHPPSYKQPKTTATCVFLLYSFRFPISILIPHQYIT